MVRQKQGTETKIALVGMDAKKIAIFEMAIKMHKRDIYLLVNANEDPDIIIVDTDNITGKELWEETCQNYADIPVIYNSSLPPTFDTFYLPKPIKIDTLFPLIKKALVGEGIYKPNEQKVEVKIKKPKIEKEDNSPVDMDNERFVVKKLQRTTALTDTDITAYETDGLLLALQKACESDKDVSLNFQGEVIMLVFPKVKKILLAIPPNNLKNLCNASYSEFTINQIESKAEWIKKANISFESCLWQVALWTAHGRLNINIKPDTVISLKQWPNMTRAAYIPDSMRLSAFLTQTTASLNILYKLMNIELKDLLNFLSVTHEVGILELDAMLDTVSNAHPLSAKMQVKGAFKGNGLQEDEVLIRQKYRAQSTGMLQKLMNKLTDKK